jgi:N-acetylglucosamine repressor
MNEAERQASRPDRPRKATLRGTRVHNERLALATIYDDGPLGRAGVARLTGLTRTTVSAVVDGLIETGLVREMGRGPSTGGKRPILLQVPEDAWHLIGLDLGDTLFRGAIVDLRGEIVYRTEVRVEEGGGERALLQVLQLIDHLLGAAVRPILGIGIGAPGLIDTTVGTVIQAVTIDWRDVPLAALVSSQYGLPTCVVNDSQAAALAEHVFGQVRTANLVVIKVGRGIGAGLVLNGDLFQGDGFGAGEIGHTVVVPRGELCRCGRHGCLETVASTRAVLARATALGAFGRTVSLDAVVAAFIAGDEDVRRIVLEAGRWLGQAVADLAAVLNIHRIVLAGTMASFGEPWLTAVHDALEMKGFPTLLRDTTLELGGIGDIVVLGASALLMTRELGLSLRRR